MSTPNSCLKFFVTLKCHNGFEGILRHMDMENSSMTFTQVEWFGKEGRERNVHPTVLESVVIKPVDNILDMSLSCQTSRRGDSELPASQLSTEPNNLRTSDNASAGTGEDATLPSGGLSTSALVDRSSGQQQIATDIENAPHTPVSVEINQAVESGGPAGHQIHDAGAATPIEPNRDSSDLLAVSSETAASYERSASDGFVTKNDLSSAVSALTTSLNSTVSALSASFESKFELIEGRLQRQIDKLGRALGSGSAGRCSPMDYEDVQVGQQLVQSNTSTN